MKNVYLGYVSLNNRDDLNLYQTDLGDIDARYTNEAGLKYAAEKLKQDHRKLDQAIFICSPAVRKSAKLLPYLKELASQMPDCEYLEIDTEDELNIYDDIPKILSCIHPDDRLFIDMTGDFRVTSVPMMLVCNYLQRRGNITEAENYSSLVNAPDGSKVGTIKSDTAGQRVMRLIDGIEEFATSARVNTLQAALADSENEHIIQLLKAMKSFSESIMLGMKVRFSRAIRVGNSNYEYEIEGAPKKLRRLKAVNKALAELSRYQSIEISLDRFSNADKEKIMNALSLSENELQFLLKSKSIHGRTSVAYDSENDEEASYSDFIIDEKNFRCL